MLKSLAAALALSTAVIVPSAYAQDEPAGDLTITGSATIASEYRLRGISQTDSDPAIQGAITVAHSSGIYVGTWASNLAGFGSFGGSNMELDLIAGFSTDVSGVTLDGGVVYYLYPGTSGTDFLDIYGAVSAPVGPVSAKAAIYYAPSDDALGGNDNTWIFGELAAAIPDTPITLKGHVGYTWGALGGPNEKYLDYAVGVDVTWKNLTANISYIGTDIDKADADAFYSVPGNKIGHKLTKGDVVLSLTAAF